MHVLIFHNNVAMIFSWTSCCIVEGGIFPCELLGRKRFNYVMSKT